MRSILWLMFLACGLFVCFGCSGPRSPAADAYGKGIELKSLERYQDALRLFQKAVDMDPKFKNAYLEIALIYDDQLEDKAQAVEWYEKYLKIETNEQQKQLVNGWLSDARAAMKEIHAATQDALGQLSPQAHELVNKLVAQERDKIVNEYKAKEQSLTARQDHDLESLKEELRKSRAAARELQDQVESITLERNALQKSSARSKSQADVAALLSSPDFRGGDQQLKQNLLTLKTQNEELQVQLGQTQSKVKQFEERTVQLRQQLAAAQQVQRSSNAAETLKKQVKGLQEDKRKLAEKVKVMEQSVDIAEGAQLARTDFAKDEEIKRLQERIADLEKDNTKVLADKQQAEQTLAELKERTDRIIASSASPTEEQSQVEENRKLRLQIAKLTSEYNEMSTKHSEMQQHAQELESEIEKYKALPQAAKPVVGSEFTDLSEEIMKMQQTIQDQKKSLAQKDSQIASLKEDKQLLDEQVRKGGSDDLNRKLVAELNQQLAEREQKVTQLQQELQRTQEAGVAYSSAADQVRTLNVDLQQLKTDLQTKDKLVQDYATKAQEVKTAYQNALAKSQSLENENRELTRRLQESTSRTAYVQPTTPARVSAPTPAPVPKTVSIAEESLPGNTPSRAALPYTGPQRSAPTARQPYALQQRRPTTTRAQLSSQRPSVTRKARPSTAAPVRQVRAYRVRPGDTLSIIAQKVYGDRTKWNVIYSANRDILPRPDAVKVGQVLYIPPR